MNICMLSDMVKKEKRMPLIPDDIVILNNLSGIDRAVPIGSSHNLGFVWDGYNIEKQLTRVIDFY